MSTELHNIPPVFDKDSKILILGSFPSVKSRQQAFFYGHPKNRFWRVISEILGEPLPVDIPEKRELLLKNHIAVWDVIASCEISGSSDSSIKNVVPNDINSILQTADIRAVFVNGKTAEKFYKKYTQSGTETAAICLPSTSPANAAKSLDDLILEWKRILEYLY